MLARRPLTAAQLIALAEPVGLSAANVKSHLTRMVARKALERRGPVRRATYQVSADQLLVVNGIRTRLEDRQDTHWDGQWLMLALALPAHRQDRERLRAALWFDGFRALGPGVFARPRWPPPWADRRARAYAQATAGYCMSGRFTVTQRAFEQLYDLDGLNSEARKLISWTDGRRNECNSPRAAFVERLTVGGQVARLIGHDPRLPPRLWGPRRSAMRDLVEAFRRFERHIAPMSDRFIKEKTKVPAARRKREQA